jgi:hypothetical protein
MDATAVMGLTESELVHYFATAAVAVLASVLTFAACFHWFKHHWFIREQRRLHKHVLRAVSEAGRRPEDLFVTGSDSMASGELVAQFKVNQGKQVVSVLESDGRRFIHVNGELTPGERSKMVRYLKSEGFMS